MGDVVVPAHMRHGKMVRQYTRHTNTSGKGSGVKDGFGKSTSSQKRFLKKLGDNYAKEGLTKSSLTNDGGTVHGVDKATHDKFLKALSDTGFAMDIGADGSGTATGKNGGVIRIGAPLSSGKSRPNAARSA